MLRSIRIRLMLWNVGILALVLAALLFTVHFAVRSFLLTTIDSRLSRLADREAERFGRRQERNDPRPPGPPRSRFSRDPRDGRDRRDPRWLCTYDMTGHLLTMGPIPATTQEPPLDTQAYAQGVAGHTMYSNIQVADTPLRLLTRPVIAASRQVGVIQAAFPLTELVDLQESLTKILLVLAPFALLAAGLGGLFLTDRALRPVREIAHSADSINASDLSHRLPVSGEDEFAHLATTINGMLGRLEGAFSRLEQSVEQERRFTSDASHELRTPLTAIKANTSLALRGERTPAQYRDALRAADRAADLMSHLVQDLLLLARSDSGQLGVQFQPVDPAQLFADAISLLSSDEETSAPISVEVADPTLRLLGDPHHLQRLVINLLDNARHYTPADGAVTLSAAPAPGGMVALTVRDTGEGISAEHLAHLGERFYRIDPARTRAHGGCGLGLSICKSIVAAHLGTIAFASTPGEGMTITVLLPAAL